jgi:hypothetical protein
VPLAFVVVAVLARQRRTSATQRAQRAILLRVGLAASGTCLIWQFVALPLLFGTAAKSFAWHRHSWLDLPRAALGWFGADGVVDASAPLAMVVVVVALATIVLIIARRPLLSPSVLLGTAALALTTTIVAGQAVLVADLIVNDERHQLPVRLCVMALVVIEAFMLLSRLGLTRRRGVIIGAAAAALVAIAGTPMLPDPLRARQPHLLIADALRAWPDAIVMTDEPTIMFAVYRRPALAPFLEIEPSTERRRSPHNELRDLASTISPARELLVVKTSMYPPSFWPPDDPCVDVRFETEDVPAGIRIALVDIGRCAVTS